MNLLVTDFCNRSCAYCFAARKVSLAETGVRPDIRFITAESFELYLQFLLRSGEQDLKLLGGEPTLHPQFPDLARAGVEAGLRVLVFTNGIWPQRVRRFVAGLTNERLQFVFNINEASFQTEWEVARERECMRLAGARASLGFNLWREDFDLGFLADLIDRYELGREVRLGLAAPIVGASNSFLPMESFERVGRHLMGQLRALEARDVLGAFDCGFPLCMFAEDDLGSLVTATTGFKSICRPVIDVGPDLTVWPCFPLSQLFNVKLLDFEDRAELEAYYTKKLAPLRSLGTRDECIDCKYLERGQCSGGCIARSVLEWATAGDPQIIRKLEVAH